MRAFVPDYELRSVRDLGEALGVLASEPSIWRPFAGGTDLMVLFEAGRLSHRKFLNLWNLPELRFISVENDFVTLGALTTYSQIQRNETLQQEFPMLCQAAAETGAIAIQNRGTLGGNIVNASPAADSPPALLVYGAQLELVSRGSSRWLPYSEFHLGYKKTALRPDELLRSVRLPRLSYSAGVTQYYRKVGTRKAQAISKVCFAGLAFVRGGVIGEARIALGSVAPTPIRCGNVEAFLQGQRLTEGLIVAAKTKVEHDIAPIDDIRSNAIFRRQVTSNLVGEFLGKLLRVELDQ